MWWATSPPAPTPETSTIDRRGPRRARHTFLSGVMSAQGLKSTAAARKKKASLASSASSSAGSSASALPPRSDGNCGIGACADPNALGGRAPAAAPAFRAGGRLKKNTRTSALRPRRLCDAKAMLSRKSERSCLKFTCTPRRARPNVLLARAAAARSNSGRAHTLTACGGLALRRVWQGEE